MQSRNLTVVPSLLHCSPIGSLGTKRIANKDRWLNWIKHLALNQEHQGSSPWRFTLSATGSFSENWKRPKVQGRLDPVRLRAVPLRNGNLAERLKALSWKGRGPFTWAHRFESCSFRNLIAEWYSAHSLVV